MSAAQPQDLSIPEQPGFGHFNQARFLALQAAPPALDNANKRSSPLSEPAQPAYGVTAANAEPVAPRGKHRNDPVESSGSARQAVDQLFNKIGMSQPLSARQKRRASDGDMAATVGIKRQQMALVPNGSTDATHPMVTRSQAVPVLPYVAPVLQTQSAVHYNIPLRFSQPTCTHCFQHRSPNCDGKAHCAQGGSHKCYYVRCDPNTCHGASCVKIHPSQYDLKARKPGEVRRLVIGDLDSLPRSQWDKHGHGRVVTAMHRGAAMDEQPFAGLPAPTQGIYQMPQRRVSGPGPGSEGRHPFNMSEAGRHAAFTRDLASTSEPAPSSPLFENRRIKVERSDN